MQVNKVYLIYIVKIPLYINLRTLKHLPSRQSVHIQFPFEDEKRALTLQTTLTIHYPLKFIFFPTKFQLIKMP